MQRNHQQKRGDHDPHDLAHAGLMYKAPITRRVIATIAPLSFAVAVSFLLGCGRSEPEAANTQTEDEKPLSEFIAIIDLNVVAQEIGARAKIDSALAKKQTELHDRLEDLDEDLGKEREKVKAQFGEDLNEQQQGELDSLWSQHQKTMSLQAQAAQSQLATQQARLKIKLLNEVRPVAYQVARANGMSIVLTTSQVYAAGPNVDITQQVIQRIREINATAQTDQITDQPAERIAEMPGGGDFLPQLGRSRNRQNSDSEQR